MGDVEEMIGELEDGTDDAEEEAPEEAASETTDEDEGTFGLDLDQAWSSPDREE